MSENNNIEQEEENYLFGKNKELSFTTPPLYFDSLSSRIINKIEALEEVSEFSILSSIHKQTDFIVPEKYFAKTENEIEYKTELEALSELSKIKKPVLEALPADYLFSLKEKISNKVELADELKAYSTLYSLDKQNNFEVQADYFDTVADKIKDRIHSGNQQKPSAIELILSVILKPKFGLSFGIVLIIGISSLVYFKGNNAVIDSGDCKTLACLEKREMLNEHTIREMDEDNLYEMVDVDKLDAQLTKSDTKDSVEIKKIKN